MKDIIYINSILDLTFYSLDYFAREIVSFLWGNSLHLQYRRQEVQLCWRNHLLKLLKQLRLPKIEMGFYIFLKEVIISLKA